MAPVPVVVAFGVLLGSLPGSGASPAAVADDDECAAQGPGAEACSMNALQRRSLKVNTVSTGEAAGDDCADLDAAPNKDCEEVVRWAADSGKWDPHASEWFADMPSVCGVDRTQANENDFHRLYFCAPPGGKQCGKPPCQCSKPPCNVCNVVQRSPSSRPGCGANPDSIHCKPPAKPFDYKGMAWPTMTFNGGQIMHIFAIGDWGGMDGSLKPIEGRPELVAYTWGARAGPSVFPRTRWDLRHEVELCSHKQFLACFSSHGDGDDCPASCGYVKGVDDQPQQLVAKAMSDRARFSDPSFILNVGDNFYWGGIEKTCGTPMDQISYTAHHQFDQIFERMYNGQGLDKKPWLSVLGNHDWGGRQFNNGWDQQIAYTWASNRWVMPAPYFSQHVEYPDQGFSVDLIFIDSNAMDAKDPAEDSEHNICSEKYNLGQGNNKQDATCARAGGPSDVWSCKDWFWSFWRENQAFAEAQLKKSTADWQIIVTHFPCGHEIGWYRMLKANLGLDLLVTGHRHDQELWAPGHPRFNDLGGLYCIVTGGGGGITSEATPVENDGNWYGEAQYGFYDLVIKKSGIDITSIDYAGRHVLSATVPPR